MNEIDLTDSRAEQVQPQGFVPSPLAVPMLRDRDARATALEYVAESLGEIRLAADIIAIPRRGPVSMSDRGMAETISQEATRLQRLVKALAVGALAALVLTVGLAAGPTAGRAEAAEVPQVTGPAVTAPASVSVVAGTAAVRIPVRTVNVTPGGFHCAIVYSGLGVLGRSCSLLPAFTVPVSTRWLPVGRTPVIVGDDVAPWTVNPITVTLDVRRASRFGLGTWTPTCYGDGLTVTAPLYAVTPGVGLTPQKASPVQVQELRAGRWVTVATLTTSSRGVASGSVVLGGGLHTVRVARRAGATVWSTVGTAHTFYLVPTDVPVNVI